MCSKKRLKWIARKVVIQRSIIGFWGTETGKYITHQKWNCPIATTVMFLFMIFSLFTLLILFSLSSFVALSPPNIQDFANMLRSVPVTHEYNHS